MALVASQPILAGEKLMAFDGPVYEWAGTTLSLPNTAPTFLRDHCIQIGEGLSRDSSGLARYANHSCEPNCGITDKIWITAMQDIEPGTALTWDYAMTEDNDWSMECGCGTDDCRGLITGFRDLPPERRRAYEGFVGEWLLEREREGRYTLSGETLVSCTKDGSIHHGTAEPVPGVQAVEGVVAGPLP